MGVRGSALWQGAILLVMAGLFGPISGCAVTEGGEVEPRLGEVASGLASASTEATVGDDASGGSTGDDSTGDDVRGDPEPQPWVSGGPKTKTGRRVPSPSPVTEPGTPRKATDEGDPEPQPWSPPGGHAIVREATPSRERRAR
jgi:hypothetical protein